MQYLVGTPKGRLTRLEQALLEQTWHAARPGVQVKLLPQDGELYVFAESQDRIAKERAMRRRQLKWLWARLQKLSTMKLTRDALLMKLGAAKAKTPSAWRLIEIAVDDQTARFEYRLDRNKLKEARRREGRYLLRTNLTETDPAQLWQFYLRRSGSRFQDAQERSSHPSGVSPTTAAYRSAYLCRVSRLLPIRHT